MCDSIFDEKMERFHLNYLYDVLMKRITVVRYSSSFQYDYISSYFYSNVPKSCPFISSPFSLYFMTFLFFMGFVY